jgi:hypothetical protein
MQKMNRDVEDAEALAKKNTQEVQDSPVAFLQVQAKKSSDFEEPLTADILKRMSPAELEAFRKFQEHPIPVEEMIRNLTKNNFAELIPDGYRLFVFISFENPEHRQLVDWLRQLMGYSYFLFF